MEWQRVPGSTRLMILGLGRRGDGSALGWKYMPNGKWFYFDANNYPLPNLVLWPTETKVLRDRNRGLIYGSWVNLANGSGSGLMTTVLFTLAGSTCLTASGSADENAGNPLMKTGLVITASGSCTVDANSGMSNDWVECLIMSERKARLNLMVLLFLVGLLLQMARPVADPNTTVLSLVFR